MNIVERRSGDLDLLRQLSQQERDARQRDRLRAVVLALEGRLTEEIMEMVGRSRPFVQQWVYAYRDGGIDAIKAKKQPGARPKLPDDRREDLERRIEAGPTEADGVCEFRGKDIQRILEEEFGVKYSLNGVYQLLHRLRYSYLSPRPRHRHSDPEAQEAFKKSAPLLLIRSGNVTRISVLKSGSKTNCESVKRER